MLSVKHRFLFIHVPKTGGNSVQSVLKKYSEDQIVTPNPWQDGHERFEVANPEYPFTKHSPLWEYRRHLPGDLYSQLFRFAALRNPWAMMISWYFSPHRRVGQWNRDGFIRLLGRVKRHRWYLRESVPPVLRTPADKDPISPLRHPTLDLPQHWNVDYLMRQETLQEDFDQVCRMIGIAEERLPVRNRSQRDDFRRYYDDELVEMVANKFADEIRFGDYSFED